MMVGWNCRGPAVGNHKSHAHSRGGRWLVGLHFSLPWKLSAVE